MASYVRIAAALAEMASSDADMSFANRLRRRMRGERLPTGGDTDAAADAERPADDRPSSSVCVTASGRATTTAPSSGMK